MIIDPDSHKEMLFGDDKIGLFVFRILTDELKLVDGGMGVEVDVDVDVDVDVGLLLVLFVWSIRAGTRPLGFNCRNCGNL